MTMAITDKARDLLGTATANVITPVTSPCNFQKKRGFICFLAQSSTITLMLGQRVPKWHSECEQVSGCNSCC